MAPKRREKTTGEKLEEIPPHHEIAETDQVPTKDEAGLCSFPGLPTSTLTASAKFEREINFPHAIQHATLAPPQFRRLISQLLHTPM